MMPMLLGKKVGMTQVYDDKGRIVPVTVLQIGPCTVTQVKTEETDGYSALQLGYGQVKKSRQKKPLAGHFKKANAPVCQIIREVRTAKPGEKNLGDVLTVAEFENVAYVDVVGTSKGKGYQGTIKRHGFKGQPASHGCERKHRSPGAIGMCSRGHSRSLKKGRRMSGHMGCDRITVKNLKVVEIDAENNLMLVGGAVAGPTDAFVMVSKAKTKS